MNDTYHSLQDAIRHIFGTDRRIVEQQRVQGGDTNDAFALTLDDGTPVFLKSNAFKALPGFRAEAEGLQAISATRSIGTAQALGIGTDPAGFSFLLLNYISSGNRVPDYWDIFAAELSQMHRASVAENRYGYFSDNYIGSREQINAWCDSWIDFYRTNRLEKQFRGAEHYFDKTDRKSFLWLTDHLDQLLVEPEQPSLVHGDLWSGNVVTGPDGKAWILDPAVYYGHPEVDLAMTELFGGFAPAFYDAYQTYANLVPGYADRRELYHFYQLLNHLNIFGASYLSSVKQIIHRYGG